MPETSSLAKVTSSVAAAATALPVDATSAHHTLGTGVQRNGCFAEFIVLPMTNVWRHSPGIPLEIAAIFDPLGNAVHTALAFPVLGEDVLVTGAGPIGVMAAAVAKHAGARHVVISDPNPYRLALAEKVGVTRAINPRTQSIASLMPELHMTEALMSGLKCLGMCTHSATCSQP